MKNKQPNPETQEKRGRGRPPGYAEFDDRLHVPIASAVKEALTRKAGKEGHPVTVVVRGLIADYIEKA